MPCGDQSAFPSDAFATIGKAILARQLSRSLLNPACDVLCYANQAIGGGDAPIPFPKPTFGAGLHDAPEAADDAEFDEVGHLLASFGSTPEDGAKMAPKAIPWTLVFKVLTTVLGLLLAAQPAPVNPAQP